MAGREVVLLAQLRAAQHTGIGTFGGGTFGSGSFGAGSTGATLAAVARPLVVDVVAPEAALAVARPRALRVDASARPLVVVAVAP